MRYFLAFFLPPLAVLSCGKPLQALLNLILTLCGILPGIVHALLVVSASNQDRRHREVLKAMQVSQALGAAAIQQQHKPPKT